MSNLNRRDVKTECAIPTLNNRDRFKRNGLRLAFCIGVSLSCTNPALASNEGPDGFSYAVQVKSSFGTKFNDCFTFDENSPGILTIQGLLGQLLTYAHDNRNRDEEDWQSTSLGSDDFGIAFHGSTNHDGKKIKGDAVNDSGDTFTFKGTKTDTCAEANPSSSGQGSNPYSH